VSSTLFWSDANQVALVTNQFTVNGVAADPTTVTLIVTDPTNVVTTYTYGGAGTIDRTSIGAYQQSVACGPNLPGLWSYEWVGTGADNDAAAGTWTVLPLTVGRWYCSLEEVKSRLGKTATDRDFEIQLAVQAAALDIEGFCGRYFWQAPDVRTYVPEDLWVQTTDDIVSVTSLMLDTTGDGIYDTTWTAGTDYVLEVSEQDYNQAASGEARPFSQIRSVGGKWFPFIWPYVHQNRIQVTGVFGWPAVPVPVKNAALMIATDFFKAGEAPFGQAGFAEYGVSKSTSEPMVADMLRRYIKSRRKVGI